MLVEGLDLSVAVGAVFAAKKFLMAGLLGWVGLALVDLTMAVYTNAEILRPHRSLGDMIVPVSMRLGKAAMLLLVSIYIIYRIGEVDLLGRFLTGLGVAGLAASLSASDALKDFGTLLLIGERTASRSAMASASAARKASSARVGFRSTRNCARQKELFLTIPNAVIAASPIRAIWPSTDADNNEEEPLQAA